MPFGIWRHPKVREGNRFAHATVALVCAFRDLGGAGTVENPAGSYLWPVLDRLMPRVPAEDIFLSQCMFGTPYRKNTRLRVYG